LVLCSVAGVAGCRGGCFREDVVAATERRSQAGACSPWPDQTFELGSSRAIQRVGGTAY
jgi:hypothetical protein